MDGYYRTPMRANPLESSIGDPRLGKNSAGCMDRASSRDTAAALCRDIRLAAWQIYIDSCPFFRYLLLFDSLEPFDGQQSGLFNNSVLFPPTFHFIPSLQHEPPSLSCLGCIGAKLDNCNGRRRSRHFFGHIRSGLDIPTQ